MCVYVWVRVRVFVCALDLLRPPDDSRVRLLFAFPLLLLRMVWQSERVRARGSERAREWERGGGRKQVGNCAKKNLRAFPLSGCFPAVWAAIACMYAMRNQIWRDTLGRSSEGFWLVVHGDENLFRFSIDVWF